jgi:hypothetical protein
MVLRIQPYYHPLPKGKGLSRSEMAVTDSVRNPLFFFTLLSFYTRTPKED